MLMMPKMYCNTQHSPSAYRQTVMQSYSHTVIQSYSHTVIQSYSHTVIQSYSHTVIQSYSHTVIQSYSHTVIQSYSHTVIQSYSHIVRQSDSQTVRQSDSQTVRQSYSALQCQHACGSRPWAALMCDVTMSAATMCAATSRPMRGLPPPCNQWEAARGAILTYHASRVSAIRSRSTGEKTKE